ALLRAPTAGGRLEHVRAAVVGVGPPPELTLLDEARDDRRQRGRRRAEVARELGRGQRPERGHGAVDRELVRRDAAAGHDLLDDRGGHLREDEELEEDRLSSNLDGHLLDDTTSS